NRVIELGTQVEI
ncbi:potassium uptake protein, partial [Escherichia coli 95.0183]